MNEETNRIAIEEMWEEARGELNKEVFDFNDIQKIKELRFFDRFDNMFTTSGEFAVVKLSDIDLLLRSCNGEENDKGRFRSLKEEDGEKWELNKDKLSTNRYNDPKRGFMYFGISMKNKTKSRKFVKTTCAKEIRAFKDEKEYISTLEFKVKNECKEKEVLDFSKISNYYSCDDIEKEMNRFGNELANMYIDIIFKKEKNFPINVFANPICVDKRKMMKEILENPIVKVLNEIILSDYLVKIFLKLINDATFTEVNIAGDKRKEVYAPFHAFANYIEDKGYSGIIYNSTVHHNGLNLVLFERDDVEFYGDIEIERKK
ncbi:RES family NAD+ phosphorylase [Terrisporobacter glycolicus]|uniref:RES family NAD+ phosphorylase n=1 Tax=Terrisporobacter glycolicus TaxID=36841 RepID=UPI003463B56F